MRVFKTQMEVDAALDQYGNLVVADNMRFDCAIVITGNIDAENIDALDIDARNIKALDIKARNIDARNIDALDINALNIKAENIDARNINAENISYYAYCIAYGSIKCKSATGRRGKCLPPQCLDGQLIIEAAEVGKAVE